jgi:hypothetical protein
MGKGFPARQRGWLVALALLVPAAAAAAAFAAVRSGAGVFFAVQVPGRDGVLAFDVDGRRITRPVRDAQARRFHDERGGATMLGFRDLSIGPIVVTKIVRMPSTESKR